MGDNLNPEALRVVEELFEHNPWQPDTVWVGGGETLAEYLDEKLARIAELEAEVSALLALLAHLEGGE